MKMCTFDIWYSHHNEIIEEEDFSLVCCLFLGLVDICHLKKSTTAHQSSVRDREDLQATRACQTFIRKPRGFEIKTTMRRLCLHITHEG